MDLNSIKENYELEELNRQKYAHLKDIGELKVETKGDTRLLWLCNQFNNPISGVMLWKGQMCWFQCFNSCYVQLEDPEFDESEWDSEELEQDPTLRYDYRFISFYKVYKLSAQIVGKMVSNHEKFCNYVSNHYYDENGVKINKAPKIKYSPNLFYGVVKECDKYGVEKWDYFLDEWEVIGKFKIGDI